MNIAVIAHLKYPISQPYHGGLEMHTHVLVEGLQARGHDVTLFALKDSDDNFSIVQPPLKAITMGQGADLFENEPGFSQHFVDRLHSYMYIMQEIQRGDFDLVHNNCLHFLPPSMAHTLDCPMVTVLHTPPFPSLQSGIMLAKNYLGNHVVAVSDSLGRAWSDYITNYEVIHNGMQPRSWRYSDRGEERTAVWVGRFCPEKGAEYAIEAARMAGYRLKLIGSVYDQAYFDREIAPRLGDDVTFLGHLDHAALSAEIGSAAVGLFTSTWDEPFGLVLIEMLACGTPVVAFDSGAVTEILTADTGRVVPKTDWMGMARAIPTAAALDRAACRQHAVERFPLRRMIDEYERLYRQLIKTAEPRFNSVKVAVDVA